MVQSIYTHRIVLYLQSNNGNVALLYSIPFGLNRTNINDFNEKQIINLNNMCLHNWITFLEQYLRALVLGFMNTIVFSVFQYFKGITNLIGFTFICIYNKKWYLSWYFNKYINILTCYRSRGLKVTHLFTATSSCSMIYIMTYMVRLICIKYLFIY